MTGVAAALVTHNAANWLDATLQSISAQSLKPDVIVVVDDGSTDETLGILQSHGIVAAAAASTAESDAASRIAANFAQAVALCAGVELVALGDHDDVWHPHRLSRQVALLEGQPDALMVASDGVIVDEAGVVVGGTIRDTFPVVDDWEALSPADRMRFALGHSVATGGASMLRPRHFGDLAVPRGWLHDRWWSLVATARGGMVIDRQTVIDYRVRQGQQVGLDTAAQRHGAFGRVGALVADTRRSVGKQRDLRRLLRPLAVDDSVAAAVSLRSVL